MDLGKISIETTWLERLILNLLSYSVVIFPIAMIVIITRCRMLPASLQTCHLVQWFVYGSSNSEEIDNRRDCIKDADDKKLLLSKASKSCKLHSDDQAKTKIVDFFWCLIGLQGSYLLWGILQEKIMTTRYPVTPGKPGNGPNQNLSMDLSSSMNGSIINPSYVTFHDSQFLVFINRIVAFVIAILALVYSQRRQTRRHADRFAIDNDKKSMILEQRYSSKPSAPLYEYIYCSMSNIMSSWCQYEALKFVNYPTQCLSKTFKVVPVMVMSKILLRKRYPALDYLSAALLALGMFVFMLYQPSNYSKLAHGQNNSGLSNQTHITSRGIDGLQHNGTLISGLIILGLYLAFDSFTSNWQQSLQSRYDVSQWQMMAAVNFYSILLTLTSLHQLGNLEPAFKLLGSSSQLLRDCMIMSIMSSVGQMFVYHTIERFGSVIFAVIMTLKNTLSVLLSFIIYRHPLNFESSLGLLLVFLVVGFQAWHKLRSGNNRRRASNPVSDGGVVAQTVSNPNTDVCIQFKSLAQ